MAQARLLGTLGAEPVVLGLGDNESAADAWRLDGIEVRLAEPSGPPIFGYSRDLGQIIETAALDCLHLHGIWQYPTHAAGRWAEKTGRPLVISPHGMLDPWITSRNAWKKHLARIGWEVRAWHAASGFHALTEAEAHDIAHETGGARIATIPNPAPAQSSWSDKPPGPNLLYIGRIHEKKNIAGLIAGWRHARQQLPAGATLTIAGWGDEAGIAALEHAMAGKDDAGLEFVGATFGSQKAALFDLARFLILPSFSEGLPMAILESWAAGVPTIMSEHCHLPQGIEAGAAIKCGTDQGSIAKTIVEALHLADGDWRAMALTARGLAGSEFAADTIAAKWERFYSVLLG